MSLSKRQKRRRRIAISAAFGILLVVLGVIGWFGWRAELERRRAEAGKLIALGEVEIDTYPTATLAWATKSLELADTLEGRQLALRALQQAPPVMVGGREGASWMNTAFSPSGKWLAHAANFRVVVGQPDGRESFLVGEFHRREKALRVAFQSDEVLVVDQVGDFHWFSVPEGRELRRVEGGRGRLSWPRGRGYFSFSESAGQGSLRWWPFEDGSSRLIGTIPNWYVADIDAGGALWETPEWSPEWSAIDIDPSGRWLAYSQKRQVLLRSLEDWGLPPVRVGWHESIVNELAVLANGELVAARDESGELRVWTGAGSPAEPLRRFQAEDLGNLRFGPTGRWLAAHGIREGVVTVHLWNLAAPQGAEPIKLKKRGGNFANVLSFHPHEPWLVSSDHQNAGFWPLSHSYPWVLRGHEGSLDSVAFTLDGDWLVSAAGDGVRAWPLRGQNQGAARVLLDRPLVAFTAIALHPSGESLAVGSREGTVLMVPLDGGPVVELPGRWRIEGGGMWLDFSPDGRHLAGIPAFAAEGHMVVRVWDLESGKVRVLDPDSGEDPFTNHLSFLDDQRILLVGTRQEVEGVSGPEEKILDLESGEVRNQARSEAIDSLAVSHDGSFRLDCTYGDSDLGPSTRMVFVWRDLKTGDSRQILTHGDDPYVLAIDPSDEWFVSGDSLGVVRAGPVSGEEPHVLIGHKGVVWSVAVSPDGRWIASGGADGTVRLWPTPDLSKPPLHVLPHDELVGKLRSLTNLRIVKDPESSSGWKLDYAPFPGWQEVPEW